MEILNSRIAVFIAILFFSSSVLAMQEIPIKVENGTIVPSRPIPSDATRVVCDGTKYIVYQQADKLPAQPAAEQSKGEFLGKEIYTAKDVKNVVAEKIADMFAATTNSGDKIADQLKIICDILALLCAKEGWVSYPQAGIQGVSSEAEAFAYIKDNLIPLLDKRNALRGEAKQFMQDKGL